MTTDIVSADDARRDDLLRAEKALLRLLPDPPHFTTRDQIMAMTDDEAMRVMRAARRMLMTQLLYQEYHEHMLDDCGDYLAAATENWANLHAAYFDNDGAGFTTFVQTWLLDADNFPLGGSDGEVRFSLLDEALLEEVFYND